MFNPKALTKSKSKKSHLIFKSNDVEVFQYTKKKISEIALIYINEKDGVARFMSAMELCLMVESFTNGQRYSMQDSANGYKAPTGGIQ